MMKSAKIFVLFVLCKPDLYHMISIHSTVCLLDCIILNVNSLVIISPLEIAGQVSLHINFGVINSCRTCNIIYVEN